MMTSTTVHGFIEGNAARTPDRIAVRDGRSTLTYAQLDHRARSIAAMLAAHGVAPGSLVGVCLERNVDLVAGVLAVMKLGAAYVPLDPDFPRERLDMMMADAGLRVVLTTRALADSAGDSSRKVFIDDFDEPGADSDEQIVFPDVATDALAYVIYTSGSTGRPKGVRITHRSVVNLLTSMTSQPGIAPDDVWLAVTTLSFDISVLELFGPLVAGAVTWVAGREDVQDGAGLVRALHASRATVMQATPVAWRLMLEAGWEGNADLLALCGGEALPSDLAAALLPRVAALWNMYGPTETTIWSLCQQVTDASAPILIGRPIANTSVYVLDASLQPLPPGVQGEIYIGGTGVADGYHEREDLVRERFLPDPFSPVPGARMYRTGDLGRYTRTGSVEYRGRADAQVKLRGFRVEPGEVEAALAALPEVRQAAVVLRVGQAGDDRLVACIVPARPLPAQQQLREALRRTLPDYMIPQHFVEMAAFPTTPNGKVDRRALLEGLVTLPESEAAFVAPSTPTETVVAAVLADILGVDRVSVDASFFDLGGHSVLAMRALARLRETCGVPLMLRDIFQTPSVATLAGRVDELTAAGNTRPGWHAGETVRETVF